MTNQAQTAQNALALLAEQQTPEAKAIIDYVKAIKEKNIVALGSDEAFVLEDSSGQIKAFRKAVTLSVNAGTLVQPTYNGTLVVSAQGYEALNEATGTSVIFPKEVLVGGEWKPNPHAERDPQNRRILAVHARAIAFKYSSMGIPQVSDWTTIFDTPSYRMIDLLAKAKKFPQAFKVLPKEMKPEAGKNETWASYPFDESMNLWINTSHNEVITWLSQILNREKKAMDFAQTFAKRNASKHIHGIQKAPSDNWRFPVLAWRPTGNNIIKWDATQYAHLQDRVAGMIEGGGADEFNHVEIEKGIERASEDQDIEILEAEVDPEDATEKPADSETDFGNKAETVENKGSAREISKHIKNLLYIAENYKEAFDQAAKEILGQPIDAEDISELDEETAVAICQKVDEIVDAQN